MPHGHRPATIARSASTARRNPYILPLVGLGAAFIVTAAVCGIATIGGYFDASELATATQFDWSSWLQGFGVALLGVEFVGLVAATVAVGSFEDAEQAHLNANGRNSQS